MGRRTLYVSYDGVLEPLGESQVLGYIERLSNDFWITLLTFEKPADLADAGRVQAMRTRLTERRIAWRPLQYHKSPPVLSTAFDILAGIRVGRRAGRGCGLVHARGYVASLIAMTVARTVWAAFIFGSGRPSFSTCAASGRTRRSTAGTGAPARVCIASRSGSSGDSLSPLMRSCR
jgi:hypothetical protein